MPSAGAALLAATAFFEAPFAMRWFCTADDEEAEVSDARETLCSRVEAREDRVVPAELLRKPYCSLIDSCGCDPFCETLVARVEVMYGDMVRESGAGETKRSGVAWPLGAPSTLVRAGAMPALTARRSTGTENEVCEPSETGCELVEAKASAAGPARAVEVEG